MPRAAATAFRTFKAAAFGPAWRGRRVAILLMAVAVLSVGDLYMTMVHLMTYGMLEGNPIARQIIAHGSPAGLVVWKLVTVGLAVGILYWARRRWTAEVGAVFCCVVMAWLTARWAIYNNDIVQMTREMHMMSPADEPQWVTMTPGG
jgi:hypothetical protein